MNDLALMNAPAIPETLASMSNDELRQELVRALEVTSDSLRHLAWIVRLLEERGEDLSDLRIGLLDYLRRIAYGQIVPELVVRYAETPGLMRTLAMLPIPDQQSIASGEPLKLVVRRSEGQFDVRMVDPLNLSRDQLSLVFGRGKIRSEAEQIVILEDRAPRPIVAKGNLRKGHIEIDTTRGGLVIGRKFFPAGEVVSALAELMGDPDHSVADVTVAAKLTEAEHLALKNAANRSGASMNVLIRRALLISGLFSGE